MSHASLKEQLQAVASELTTTKTANEKNKVYKPNYSKANQQSSHVKQSGKIEKPKPKWLDYVQYGVLLLKAYFPSAFLPVNQIKPLKKGIKQDLVLRLSILDKVATDDKACMVKSLAYYVNTMSYLKSVVANAERIDLDGKTAGVVSEEEAKYSAERYLVKQKNKQSAVIKSEEKTEETSAVD